MDNSILTPKYLQAILEENEEVRNVLGLTENDTETEKIFPLKQPDVLEFPYIVYTRSTINVQYTKDYPMGFGWSNTVSFEIACVSDDYMESIELANAVRHAVEGYRWTDRDEQGKIIIKIDPIRISAISEFMIESDAADVYVQSIMIEMHVE